MPDTPNPQLLCSLGKLARGLSALFWGMPAALLVCAETSLAEWPRPLGFLPALAANALLFYGLLQMGDFQKQERPWRAALDRAQLLSLILLGLCPFIYWHYRQPGQFFFSAAVGLLVLAAVLFLFNLNLVLLRLGAMLPDETLRGETRQFTALNRWLIVALLFFRRRRCRPDAVPSPVAPCRADARLAGARQRPAADFFHPAAAGHDHGADLENQGGHPRLCLWRAGLKGLAHVPLPANPGQGQLNWLLTSAILPAYDID